MEKFPQPEAAMETVIPAELEHDSTALNERYEKEVLPVLAVLKPDDMSFEAYEQQVMEQLGAAVKNKQLAENRLSEDPEKTLVEQEAQLHKWLVTIANNEKTEVDELYKAQAALITSGNLEGWDQLEYRYHFAEHQVGEMAKPIFDHYVKQRDFATIDHILNNISVSEAKMENRNLGYYFIPNYAGINRWSEEERHRILTGNMSYSAFKYDRLALANEPIGHYLIPHKHEERYFLESNGVNHYRLMDALGLFKRGVAETELEKELEMLRDARNQPQAFEQINDEKINHISSQLKKLIIENRAALEVVQKDELFRAFDRNDYKMLLDSGTALEAINPDDLPPYMEEDSRAFLVDQWKHKFIHEGKAWYPPAKLRSLLRLFTLEDIEDLKARGVDIDPSEIPECRLKEFGPDVLRLYDSYQEFTADEKLSFLEKIKKTDFLEVLSALQFDVMDVDEIIQRANSIPKEQLDDFLYVNYDIETLNEHTITGYRFCENPNDRAKTFATLKEKLALLENATERSTKETHLRNIEQSFLIKEQSKELPREIAEVAHRFKHRYGSKGETLVALSIAAYGLENSEQLMHKLSSLEKVIDKYDPSAIPDGAHVSMGIEYEVTKQLSRAYKKGSLLGYKKDIELMSRAAGIGAGRDGVHELALKPTYNPYIMLAEVQLLQEAGFMDLNFKRYPEAPRGYHLSLVGQDGLDVNSDTWFLYNALTMAQLAGPLAGNTIYSAKHIARKQYDDFETVKQKGMRVEMKGMACENVEQFEKAVLTSHHAGIAIQVVNKYMIPDYPNYFENFPESAEELQQYLLLQGKLEKLFESEQDKNIVFAWLSFKNSIVDAVKQHNKSFVDSEFNGYFFDKKDQYIDTGEHIDTVRNKKLTDEPLDQLQKSLKTDERFLFAEPNPDFINTIIKTNNIFLKSSEQTGENSPVNAQSMLTTMRTENYGEILDGDGTESIFDIGGATRDGYYVVQGASEEMITHKSQILLNRFNRTMDMLLQKQVNKRAPETVNQ